MIAVDLRITFAELFEAHPWRPIRGCPGRSVWASTTPPEELLRLTERVGIPRQHSEAAPDPVIIAAIDGGGLISFEKSDGQFVHTLNTPEGFTRKLNQLGLRHE